MSAVGRSNSDQSHPLSHVKRKRPRQHNSHSRKKIVPVVKKSLTRLRQTKEGAKQKFSSISIPKIQAKRNRKTIYKAIRACQQRLKENEKDPRLYIKLARLASFLGNNEAALKHLRLGTKVIRTSLPLWIEYFKMLGENHKDNLEKLTINLAKHENALCKFSNELQLKFCSFIAPLYAEKGCFDQSDDKECIGKCPDHLKSQLYLLLAKTSLIQNKERASARQYCKRALELCPPDKLEEVLCSLICLEDCFELRGTALKKLLRGKKTDWRSYYILFCSLLRWGNFETAKKLIQQGIKKFPENGRLWQLYIRSSSSIKEKVKLLKIALKKAPNSGELLCEAGILYMDPDFEKRNLGQAKIYLKTAMKLSPQYGDSCIEYIRLLRLAGGSKQDFFQLEFDCIQANPQYGFLWDICKTNDSDNPSKVFKYAMRLIALELIQDVYKKEGKNIARLKQSIMPQKKFRSPTYGGLSWTTFREFRANRWISQDLIKRLILGQTKLFS